MHPECLDFRLDDNATTDQQFAVCHWKDNNLIEVVTRCPTPQAAMLYARLRAKEMSIFSMGEGTSNLFESYELPIAEEVTVELTDDDAHKLACFQLMLDALELVANEYRTVKRPLSVVKQVVFDAIDMAHKRRPLRVSEPVTDSTTASSD